MKKSILYLAFCVALNPQAYAQEGAVDLFRTQTEYTILGEAAGLFLVDLDGDGDLDLAVANWPRDEVTVLLNRGDGTFSNRSSLAAGTAPVGVFSADLDGDGDNDLAAANAQSDNLSVFLNNGRGTFAPRVNYPTGYAPQPVVGADFDGDGDWDLATANAAENVVSVLSNHGNATFGPRVDYATGLLPAGLFGIDLDGDGDQDLVTANESSTASVLLNNGNGTFAHKVDYIAMPGCTGIFCGDLDGDQDADLAVASFGSHPEGSGIISGTEVSVLLNHGNGTFATRVTYETGLQPTDVFGADFNGDGSLDLAVTNYASDEVSVLFNRGDGTFGSKVDYFVIQPSPVVSGDLDRDGDQDLVVGTAGIVVVFLNVAPVPAIVVAQEQIDFGVVDVGRSVQRTITVRNGGPGDLQVTEIRSAVAGLSVLQEAFTVAPGASQTVTVDVKASVEGAFSGILEIVSDDPKFGVMTVSISGTAVSVPVDPRTDFDANGKIEFADFLSFVRAFGSTDATFDLDGSGTVDFGDFLSFARSFGKSVN